ncbi:MAG: zinc transporter ZupT [Candidatus Bipolaricaulota bacterium]|nr:zinc transporter ZupT [Candidatus Bipolaricaulota bacterium]
MGHGVGLGLLLATLAGLSTLIGAVVAIRTRTPGPRFMAFTLGLSGGVMVYVSFVELLGGAVDVLGFLPAQAAFFLGMGVMFLIDVAIPHEYLAEHVCRTEDERKAQLMKTGLFVALGIGIHNFPEGMITFTGALHNPSVGFAIATAIAIHNIPEGIAVAVPILAATGSRRKAFTWAALSGLAEPVGAGLAAAVLAPILSDRVLGYALAAVAGIMVFVALDELIPVARDFDRGHWSIVGLIVGMMVMAGSLVLLTHP